MESMAEYSQPKLTVIRDGNLYFADARAIVNGDVILLSKGDILPCDVRIVSCQDFSVSTYEGKRSAENETVFKKNADAMYSQETVMKLYEYENIVCAGSQVQSGSARVIAVETGKHTYIGALDGGIFMNSGSDVIPALRGLKKTALIYSFITMALILPLTILGVFTFGTKSILDVFLLITALSVSALGELIYIIGGIIVSSGLMELADDTQNDNSAIIKNLDNFDKMASPDYLILLGDAALSDGTYKISRLLVGDEELSGESLLSQKAFRFTELVAMNEYARNLSPVAGNTEKRQLRDAVIGYGKRIGVDVDTFSARVRTAAHYPAMGGLHEVTAMLLHGERVSVFTSENRDLIEKCTFIRTQSGNVPLTQELKAEMSEYISDMQNGGLRFLICATSNAVQNGRPADKGLLLEGIASFAKTRLHDVLTCKEQFEKSDTRMLVFIDGENRARIAQICRMLSLSPSKDVVMASSVGNNANVILKKSQTHSAFAGFSQDSISGFVELLKNEKKSVMAVGITDKNEKALEASDVSVTFGDFCYKTAGMDFSKLETMPEIGGENAREGAQTLRYTSDALIKRPTNKGGGLSALLNIKRVVSGIHVNLESVITYLVCAQVLRTLVVAFSVAFGIFLLTPAQILFGGLMLDFCAAMCFAFDSHMNIEKRKASYSPKAIFSRLKMPFICATIASVAAVAASLPIALLARTDVSRAVFLSVTLVQIAAFFLIRINAKVKKIFTPLSIALLASGLLVCTLFSLVTPLATVFGASYSGLLPFSTVLVSPLIFSLTYFLLCMKTHKQ